MRPSHCFAVQTHAAQHGGAPSFCDVPVEADRPYDVAVRFDWDRAMISVFIDGRELVREKAFDATHTIRYAALYNWRSSARAAFSEIALGNAAPHLARSHGPGAPPLVRCPARRRTSSQR